MYVCMCFVMQYRRRSHIKFLEDHMIIKVEKSKTDQLRQGDEVVIARSGVALVQFPLFE